MVVVGGGGYNKLVRTQGKGGITKCTCAYQRGEGVILFTKNCVCTKWMTPIDKFAGNKVFDKDIFKQTHVGLQDVLKTSSRHILRRLEDFINVAVSGFHDILKTSWETRNCYDFGKTFF